MRGVKADYLTADLLNYCINDLERKVVETRLKCRNHTEAGKILNMGRHKVGRIIKNVYERMSTSIERPLDTESDDDNNVGCNLQEKTIKLPQYIIKGESVLCDAEGNVKLRWVKTKANEEMMLTALQEAVENMLTDLENKIKNYNFKLPKIKKTIDDEITIYPIGDMHIGMFSWSKETEEDYDIDIAYQTSHAVYDKLFNSAPNTDEAIIVNLGDFFHIDNYDGVTQRSGNRLDFDTRWPKILETGLQIIVEIILKALNKHRKVIIRNAIGNHDTHTTIFLNAYLKAWFKNNPRVVIEDQPTVFWYYKWGKNLIGVTHGDTVKLTDLPEIMAHDAAQYWSDTEYRYWYIGHVHHSQKKEFRTCVVESFGTIAAKDAWHYASGYRSQRQAKYKVLHKEFGEIQEGTVNVNQILERLKNG